VWGTSEQSFTSFLSPGRNEMAGNYAISLIVFCFPHAELLQVKEKKDGSSLTILPDICEMQTFEES